MKGRIHFLKTIAILLVFGIVSTSLVLASEVSEAIELDIKFLGDSSYEKIEQKFTMIDLRPYANRDFTDEVEGDSKGGWSDQGHNDMRNFKFRGVTEFLNIPFDIINPEDNDGKALLAVQGQYDKGVSNSYEISINQTAAGVYFLHSSPWANGSYIGKYTLRYTDGTEAYVNIFDSVHIADCYGKSNNENFRAIWTGKNAVLDPLSLYLFAMSNPHPEKEIETLKVETDGGGPYIMIVGITLTDSGPYLPMTADMSMYNIETSQWNTSENIDTDLLKGSPLDVSYLLDAPAGKHGKLRASGDEFVFDDGTKIKFWGTNIVGKSAFPTKEQADKISVILACGGYNLVRFSDLSNDYLKLDVESKNRLAYLVSKLKENGIYCYLSGDRTTKIETFYDTDTITRQKEFFRDILTYQNIYTGNKLGNDFCMIELVDGASMFDYTSSKTHFNALESKDTLEKLFNEYLVEKYKTHSNLLKAWTGISDLNSWENLSKMNIELPGTWKYGYFSLNKKNDISEFFEKVQLKYYYEMNSYIKSLGVDLLITSNTNSDQEITTNDSHINSETDFVARSGLWERPASLYEELDMPGCYDGKKSNLRNTDGGVFKLFAKSRISDTPFIISKYGSPFLNSYSGELPVMMAILGGQQGWNPIHYSFLCGDGVSSKIMDDHYSSYNNPSISGFMPSMAVLFHSAEELDKVNYDYVTKGEVFEHSDKQQLSTQKMFENKSGLVFSNSPSINMFNKYGKSIIENKEMYWDLQEGILFAETNKAEAIAGFINTKENLKHFEIIPKSDFYAVSLVCLDNKDFDNSDRYLLSLYGRVRNKDMNIDKQGYIINKGTDTVLFENTNAEIILKLDGDLKVYSISQSGERIEELVTEKLSKGYTKIIIDETNAKSINYVIEREI